MEIEAIWDERNEPDIKIKKKTQHFPLRDCYLQKDDCILLLRYLGMMHLVILYNGLFE